VSASFRFYKANSTVKVLQREKTCFVSSISQVVKALGWDPARLGGFTLTSALVANPPPQPPVCEDLGITI